MRSIILAKRNLKEILRDPLSLIFNFLFPILMLVLFYCFVIGKSKEEIELNMPMFLPNNIIPAVAIFGFSFLTLFSGMLVAKDRTTAFSIRLKASPLKARELFIGYFLPMIIIAYLQMLLVYFVGMILTLVVFHSLEFLDLRILITFFSNFFIIALFISIGILIGLLFSDKAVGGIASIIVNISALTSGMFMPINMMGGFKYVAQTLPFYHALTLSQNITIGFYPSTINDFSEMINKYQFVGVNVVYNIFDTWWMHLLMILIFTILVILFTILVFKKKLDMDD